MSDVFTSLVALQPAVPAVSTSGTAAHIPGTAKPQVQAAYTLIRSTGVKTK